MPQSSDKSLSVVVHQDYLTKTWRVTWYLLQRDGQLLLDGAQEYSTDMVDGAQLDTELAALYERLLLLL